MGELYSARRASRRKPDVKNRPITSGLRRNAHRLATVRPSE